jgi:CMP-N-acetylneuraminic acid synthetase
MMEFVCLICVRRGSKGLPGKNIKLLDGIPLITRTISQARIINRISRIIVSTDSREIAELAVQAGAEVPFLRPDELAADNAPEWKVWQHALEYIHNETGKLPEGLAVLPVTSPLRNTDDINACLDKFETEKPDVVITITDSHRNPYFNMVCMNDSGQPQLVIPPSSTVFRRQDAPVTYDMTTVAFIADPEFVLQHEGIWEGQVSHVHIPLERALDIDTEYDFKIAEALIDKG